MTATISPRSPARPSPPPTATPSFQRPPARRTGSGLLLATEVALAGVTAAAVLGMHRLFADGSYRAPVLLQVALAHTAMAVVRRRDMPLRAAAPLSLVLATLSIGWSQYSGTTWLGLPTPGTITAGLDDISAAWSIFDDVRTPAPVAPGFVTAASLAVWIIAFIADWGAFRTGVSFESLLPPATLFLFSAVLAAPGGRVASAALFAAAALLFLLMHRTWRQEDTASWVASRHRQARRALVLSGLGLAAISVGAAVVIGPNLPGADDTGLVPWKNLNRDDETRVVISPLVDIQSRLLDQSDLQVFTAEGDPGAGPYWRLTALDQYEDGIWKSSYSTDDASGELPRALAGDDDSIAANVRTQRLRFRITIEALAAIWLPAPFEARAIDPDDDSTTVGYDAASATLLVDRETHNSDGLAYEVTSDVPAWSGADLRRAPPAVIDDFTERYLALPDGFSERITERAREVTSRAQTPYDQALALQNWFRSDEFTYSQEVQAGHEEDALEQFIFENKIGYCEQFAGAYGAMARSIGLPSRVVVGFTRGSEDPNQPGLYVVKGRQAHAWVEVYFRGFGWVTFDPTPGRSPQGAEGWLDMPGGQQDDPGAAGSTEVTTGPPGGPVPGGPATPNAAPGTGPEGDVGVEVLPPPSEEDDDGLLPKALPETVASAGKASGLATVAYLLLVPLAIVLQRQLRRRRAREPAQRVDLAWQEVNEDLTAAGLQLSASLTVAERAAKMRLAVPEAARSVDLLAHSLEQVTYAERTPSDAEAGTVVVAATDVSNAAARQQPWWRRPLRYLDVRRLVPTSDRARRSAHG